jgi:hypothetical protein
MSDRSRLYRSTWDCVVKTYQEGGLLAFYRVSFLPPFSLLIFDSGVGPVVLEDWTLHSDLLPSHGTREEILWV